MKKQISWSDEIELLKKALSGEGAFLVVLDKEGKGNPMTIGWGEVGIVWSLPVFTVLVRRSRYTYLCLQSSGEFTVNVPSPGTLENELQFCGTKSGRDLDKAAACELTLIAGRKVKTPVIEECALHYECRILARKQLEETDFSSSDILEEHYKDDDHHMIVMGKILTAYAFNP
ncbi:MAG: flavin reductase family protein [Candidatus Bipolaricaulota bacterium]|nr:flavin reductase family protein [Candidatus Bipolaricaulota bacterium]